MTTDDRKEVKEILEDAIKYRVEAKLELILQQTTKTNGRINVLEDKVQIIEKSALTHHNSCPNTALVQELSIDKKIKLSTKQLLISTLVLISMVLGIVFTTMKVGDWMNERNEIEFKQKLEQILREKQSTQHQRNLNEAVMTFFEDSVLDKNKYYIPYKDLL